MNVLNLPRPAWMTEDLVLLEEQARRFIAAEFVPHIERWNEDGIYDARGVDQGRRGRAAVRRRCRRNTAAPAAPSRTRR